MPGEFLGVAPWVIVTAAVTWGTQLYVFRGKRFARQVQAGVEHDERMIVHRDGLTFELLKNARQEMDSTRHEIDGLRTEIQKLRSLETHYFHFQQSLDHLEAIIVAKTSQERLTAERNARAFLNRMRRLQNAKGTLANEVQHASSEIELLDRGKKLGEKP